ncbi:hypothetical protein J5N97_016457 [Dioscorea zingiberensis]|uniref:BHLH domain-containing protein n=1 Tax=Dioscorea zingiberensis TaxID=325984 RepID=A0A9D5HFP2_9LILI|nr:hypothetical protein J5N97_016457 [Dioscorea zingiberensis]
MAQESLEASVASSSSTPSWWPELHATPLSSWQTISQWQPHNSHHSTSSCEEELSVSTASFANTGGHSGLSIDSPPPGDLPQEPVAMENQLWSQVLLRVGSGGHDMRQNQEERENFNEVLSSRREMFNPACDYLKKMDSSTWEINNPHTLNILEKQLNSYNNGELMEHERLTNLSDLVSNWSIAPPDPHLDHQIAPSPCFQYVKHEIPNSLANYPSNSGVFIDRNSSYMPYNMHEIKMESKHHDIGSAEASILRPFSTSDHMGYHIGVSNSDVPWSGGRNNASDFISFKPVEFRDSKIFIKSSDSSTRGSGRSTGTTTTTTTSTTTTTTTTTNEGKKKRSEDNSETLLKRTKHENSNLSSSLKLHVPKLKLADRITALQQIVSPFGKTDTASVLMEAINYIRFLHEQIQLLSDPYMKSNANKDHSSWGGVERKERGDQKLDLRSRGLCVVPVSCTPEIYKENNGPDYWTPTYRGCLYR